MDEIEKSNEPCVCLWFLENVVIEGKTVEECTDYEKRG
jgi:hypothetical protein